MKQANTYLSVVIVMGVIATLLFLAISGAGPELLTGTHTVPLVQASTPTPPPNNVIPLKSITDFTSLNATVKLTANGLINGKRVNGDLTAQVTTNDQSKSQVTLSGSLLGPIVAQVGGSLVGLFTPSKVDLYKVPGGTYIAVNSLVPICVKTNPTDSTAALDDLSPQGLLNMLTSSDVARGQLVGQETRNGVPVLHYVVDGKTFLTAAQNSSNPKLRDFGKGLWSAKDADLFVDASGGYPVAFNGSYSGAFEPLKFEGDFDVQIELTGVNNNTRVDLPSSCNNPIVR